MTIVIWFHCSGYKNLKQFYLEYVCKHLKQEFPKMFFKSSFAQCSGISIIDSTSINVCHNRRIKRNRVLSGVAERSKTTMGWFLSFKVHIIINDRGELLSVTLTKGNLDDRKPVPHMVKNIFSKLFGDTCYLSSALSEQLRSKWISLITTAEI